MFDLIFFTLAGVAEFFKEYFYKSFPQKIAPQPTSFETFLANVRSPQARDGPPGSDRLGLRTFREILKAFTIAGLKLKVSD